MDLFVSASLIEKTDKSGHVILLKCGQRRNATNVLLWETVPTVNQMGNYRVSVHQLSGNNKVQN